MKRYIVSTHLGDFETMATSPQKAVSNLRWRLFHGSAAASRFVAGWAVKDAEDAK